MTIWVGFILKVIYLGAKNCNSFFIRWNATRSRSTCWMPTAIWWNTGIGFFSLFQSSSSDFRSIGMVELDATFWAMLIITQETNRPQCWAAILVSECFELKGHPRGSKLQVCVWKKLKKGKNRNNRERTNDDDDTEGSKLILTFKWRGF